MTHPLWTHPHHDGSEPYVPDPMPTLGGKVAVRLPAAVVGVELKGLAGSDDLQAGADGWVTLPAGGPAFGMWRLIDSL